MHNVAKINSCDNPGKWQKNFGEFQTIRQSFLPPKFLTIWYITMRLRTKLEIKIQTTFHPNDERQTVKFNYRKVFVPYGIVHSVCH